MMLPFISTTPLLLGEVDHVNSYNAHSLRDPKIRYTLTLRSLPQGPQGSLAYLGVANIKSN